LADRKNGCPVAASAGHGISSGRSMPADSRACFPRSHQPDYAEWGNFLGNKALVEALLSRLRHQCHTVKIDGPSHRDPLR